MAETLAASGLTVQQWDDKFFFEYLRQNRFQPYMGTNENAVIHVKENLTKAQGDSVTYSLVNNLDGAGVTGNTLLEGAEEALDSRSHKVSVDVLRHAVKVTDWEQQKSAIDLRNAARTALKNWAMKQLRSSIITAMQSIDGVAYASATAAQRNTWITNNVDRVLVGAAVSNYNATHATALANIDNTNDKLTPGMISLAKRIARTANPAITPVTVKNDEEWYVMFCGSLAFRDLANNATMTQANRDALERGKGNPLFTGGDLIWDGVIVKEIPEIPIITGAGAGGIDVAVNFLCGAQAVGVAWAKRTKSTMDESDYQFRHGIGIMEIRGIEKLRFGTGASDTTTPKDHGIVTVFSAGVADS